MPPHPLTNFELQTYYENEPKFKGVNFEPFHEYKSIGTQWIALYVNDDNVIYFDSFGVEHIPKEIKIS